MHCPLLQYAVDLKKRGNEILYQRKHFSRLFLALWAEMDDGLCGIYNSMLEIDQEAQSKVTGLDFKRFNEFSNRLKVRHAAVQHG